MRNSHANLCLANTLIRRPTPAQTALKWQISLLAPKELKNNLLPKGCRYNRHSLVKA